MLRPSLSFCIPSALCAMPMFRRRAGAALTEGSKVMLRPRRAVASPTLIAALCAVAVSTAAWITAVAVTAASGRYFDVVSLAFPTNLCRI